MIKVDPKRYLRIVEDPWYRGLVSVQDIISFETAVFWKKRGVKCLHLPITTNAVSSPMGLGSDSEPVAIELFGVRTYLADSMQFMLEYGCRLAKEGTYYLMPSFRGEPSDKVHLNQFFHSEAEIPGGLEDVVRVADEYVRHLATAVLREHSSLVEDLAGDTKHVEEFLASPSARITFDDAAEMLTGEEDVIVQHDGWRSISRKGERLLIERLGPAVWLTNFDRLSTPFYQAASPEGRGALCADLLLGPGEIIGCGERHTTGDEVRDALHDHRVPPEDYRWYTELKDAAPMRTSGFGMGVERFIMWLLRSDDIRNLQLAERYNGVLTAP
ncbi:asparagine synthetase A [Nocardiopsis sp. NPDC007018]|uniref:asparagine synthetase A n=1 Tax=Nocardiopsis sp. NPDC007018 TaxID=3155721 RepID=UPI0033F3B063